MPFMTIDFEASCLPQYGRSFPIEVGIACPSGWSCSWLIRPHRNWAGWQWTTEAEELHGLSLDRLEREGLDVKDVAQRLRAAVGPDQLIADSHLDDQWSRILFEAAGDTPHLPVMCLADLPAFHAIGHERLTQALAEADQQRQRRHRAEDDARWLARLIDELGLRTDDDAQMRGRSSQMRQLAAA
jgi:DNA polymerase III epsilon subunit-like protein